MSYFFTLQAASPEALRIGSVIDLKSNKSDKCGVDAYLNGKKVGAIVNDLSLSIRGADKTAEFIRKSALDHPKCKSAHGLVVNYETRMGRGTQTYLYGVELYIVPIRQNDQKDSNLLHYKAGGSTTQNTKKAAYMAKVQKLLNDKEPVNIPVAILREQMGGTDIFFVCPEAVSAGASAGQISHPDAELEALVGIGESIPATIVGLERHSFKIDISPKTTSIENYLPAIDAAISRCAGQSNVLEQKVQTMMDARFSEDMIVAAVGQMPSLGFTRNGVPNPKITYSQRKGSNLPDLVGYMLMGKMVRLVGEKGSGKNTLVETACWLLNRPLCRVQGSSELDKLDLLGSQTLKNGNTAFELSAFLTTLRDDGVAVVDEVNTVRPEVLTVLHSLTDGARAIDVPGYGTVKMGPHACILYTLNEDYVGTGEMNAATVDRGPSMFIEQESNMSDLLRRAVPDASDDNIKICCKVSDEVRKSVKSGNSTLSADAITVRGYIDALQCAGFIPLRRALIQNVANKAQTASERQAIEGIITANVA